jgi:hypothetical protein
MQDQEEKQAENVDNSGIAGKIEQVGNGYNSQGVPDKRPGRNDPCHCGSERKYKKCCLEKDDDLLREAEDQANQERLIRMCQGKLQFDEPSAIKVLSAHTDGWMQSHLDDIKYLKSLIRALKALPASGSDSFVTLHDNIVTRDSLIAEYEDSLKEMTGRLCRKDYMTEYALSELMNKSYFMDQMDHRPEGDITSPTEDKEFTHDPITGRDADTTESEASDCTA